MAEIIKARVWQKIDTEANWNANPLILGPGEAAFVVTPSGAPVNFKLGDGTKTFAQLPWYFDWGVQAGVPKAATPSTVFPPGEPGFYQPEVNGTYNGITVDLSEGVNYLIWDGASLSKIVYPINLAGYTATGGSTKTTQEIDNEKPNRISLDAAVAEDGIYKLASLPSEFLSTSGAADGIVGDTFFGKNISVVIDSSEINYYRFPAMPAADGNTKTVELFGKVNTIFENPAMGLGYGDVNDTSTLFAVYYRSDGSIFVTANNAVTGGLRRPATPALAYTDGDVVSLQLVINRDGTVYVYTSKNGVYSDGTSITDVAFNGSLLVAIRGSEMDAEYNIKDSTTTLSTEIALSNALASTDLVVHTESFRQRELETYITYGTATVNALQYGGRGLVADVSGAASNVLAFTHMTDISFKDMDSVVLSMDIRFHENNPILGLAFGIYGTDITGVGYRQDGSVSVITNGVFTNPRPANASYAYTAGDKVELILSINKSSGIVGVRTRKNGELAPDGPYIVEVGDFTNNYLYRRGTSISFNTLIYYVDNPFSQGGGYSGSIQDLHVAVTGSDTTGNGTSINPYRTITKAAAEISGAGRVLVSQGVYRETVDLSAMGDKEIMIEAKTPDLVQVYGSDQITGWSKTAGRTNVYQAGFTGTIINQSRLGRRIYEHGAPSMPISAGDREPLQRGLTERLPFTALVSVGSVSDCDSTPGSFYHDGTILYVHTVNSDDPATNGHSFENIARAGLVTPASSSDAKGVVHLKNIQFLYHTGCTFSGLSRVHRYSCTSLASSGVGGFRDDVPFFITYKDESAFCSGDGINGHYNTMPDYTNKDQREGVQVGIYFDPWCHDNADDGFSFHERSDITIQGGLFEYNGDGGVRQSGDALFRIYNAKSRGNGWDPAAGTSGSGFDMVNAPSANRIAGTMSLYGCVSENNRNGIGVITGDGTLNVYQCITRNNSDAEYLAESGVVNLYNCRAENSDPGKIKVTSGTGAINVYNATEVS